MKLSLDLVPSKKRRRARKPPADERIVAYEYQTPRRWSTAGPVGFFTVLTSDRYLALEMVYSLGYTTGDIACGHIDLVPITWKERQRLAKER